MATPNDRDQLRAWVRTWASAGPALQAVRDQELSSADTIRAVQALAGAFRDACRRLGYRAASGLIEQQRLFQRLRS